jgi:hypothetical protein
MADFSALLKTGKGKDGARLPPRVIALPPSAWADHRDDKPREPVRIGIRLISEEDTQIARSEAAKVAVEIVPVGDEDDRIAAYNDALMRFAAERGTCSPTNAEDPYFVMGEMEIRERLTPEGVRRLWHEIEGLHVASNPSVSEIDDEGLAELFALLHHGALDRLEKSDASRVRRLLELCRVDLAELDEQHDLAG